jgi:hypothetical protein
MAEPGSGGFDRIYAEARFMCESGLSGWISRACFHAVMADGVFSAGRTG